MCVVPNSGVQIFLFLAIPITTAVTIATIVATIMSLQGSIKPLHYLCLIVECFLVLGLSVGYYGTIYRKIVFLQIMLFIISVSLVVLTFKWIIAVNGDEVDKLIPNIWFQCSLACSVVCFLFAVIYCLRLSELE